MAKQTKPRLGRGLSSLIGQPVEVAPPTSPIARSQPKQNTIIEPAREPGEVAGVGRLRSIAAGSIVPSPYQPRFDPTDADLETLAASIRSSGVMQPIAVRPIPASDPRHGASAQYELIAGERRWRAAQLAGLDHLPALVASLSDQESAEWALVENIQREDLSALERGEALRRLSERFNLSHASLGDRLGIDRSTVSNFIRLTELEPEIKELLSSNMLSGGHAKALLGMAPGSERVRMARAAAKGGWSVRRLEQATSAPRTSADAPTPGRAFPSPHIASLEKQLADQLGTRVRLKTDSSGKKGTITIHFFGVDHFEGVVRALGVEFES